MADNVESNTSLESESSEVPVSMVDVLEGQKQVEEDAIAVLGDGDMQNCTYYMGYVPRQALYSCITCVDPKKAVSAGVCLACSLECHEGHDLVELYTKRNFRCDCGNAKFGGAKCKLVNKADLNEDNVYGQNFQGKYCMCARPYPDPEDDTDDEMLQCVVCEDWFHGRHLNSKVPEDNCYDEMICEFCMDKCSFLTAYTNYSTGAKDEKIEIDSPKKAEGDNSPTKSPKSTSPKSSSLSSPDKVSKEENSPRPGSSTEDTPLKDCKKKQLEKLNKYANVRKGATFWLEGWRQQLCKCLDCTTMYENLKVTYLLDENDTIAAYESRGKLKAGENQYESGMKALSGMDRFQQVEMLHGYNDMKSELTEYLKKFAENGKVVREEDIKEFFQELAAKKKQKKNPASQYYCK